MEISALPSIIEFINGVGFPIATCIALFYSNHRTTTIYGKTLKEFKDVLHENTKTLSKLSEQVNKS